jgi:hypothetical protein
MLVRRIAFAAFTASALMSSAFAGQTFAAVAGHDVGSQAAGRHGLDSKDHTPLLEQCAAYEAEFTRAIANRPATHKVVEAQRLYNQGVHLCNMDQTKATQGANEISEALQLIGAQPRVF